MRKKQSVFFNTTKNVMLKSIDFIIENEPDEGYFVGFSGGKDSIVLAQLMRISGVKYGLFYSCTRIDPPEVIKFIRENYPQVTFMYPKTTFWKGIRTNGPPTHFRRWCCQDLKHFKSKYDSEYRVFGIRAEESTRRKKYKQISERPGFTAYYPIFHWKEWNIWEFIEGNNLKYPKLYDEGFNRIGCVVCPFRTYKEHLMGMQKWEPQYKLFEKIAKEYYERKIKDNITHIKSFAHYIDCWYRSEWPKQNIDNTSKGFF